MESVVHPVPGNPDPEPCPVGHYCEEGTGPLDCPRLHYRDVVLGADITDCFPCLAGYWCNVTGTEGMDYAMVTSRKALGI